MPEPSAACSTDLATLLVTVDQAAVILNVGRSKVFELIARGDLVSVKIDRCRRVPYEALTAYVSSLMQEDAQ